MKISPAHFLKNHWQKKPLLVRGAFPHFRDPVTPDELAGLACAEDVESRLVMERGGRKPWQVLHGPQDPARLRRLPPSHWTLLVQGVDRRVPGVAALLESFRFIPDWRVDDVMVSFAPPRGSVGPHVDSYDVFLIQGKGRRRWRIDGGSAGECKPGLDLRILKKFRPTREWVLEAGDMLYLPPGVGHHGVALEDCLTYSVGFRAPGAMDLLGAAVQKLAGQDLSDLRYRDPRLQPGRPGEIPPAVVKAMRSLLWKGMERLTAEGMDVLVGELLTEPKSAGAVEGKACGAPEIRSRLARGFVLARAPGSRLAYLRRGAAADLFADGRRFVLPPALSFAAPLLTGERRFDRKALAKGLARKDFVALLASLASAGSFRWERSGKGAESRPR